MQTGVICVSLGKMSHSTNILLYALLIFMICLYSIFSSFVFYCTSFQQIYLCFEGANATRPAVGANWSFLGPAWCTIYHVWCTCLARIYNLSCIVWWQEVARFLEFVMSGAPFLARWLVNLPCRV